MARLARLAVALLLAAGGRSGRAQLSDPIALDRQVDTASNKFLQRQAHRDDAVPSASDEVSVSGQCDANLALKWMAELSSSIYATPLITDLFSDGHKDIIVPSFVHYLEVVDGGTGGKATEDAWPAFHRSTVHASPLLHDWDGDNVPDVLLATYDGEVLAYRDTGERLPDKITVPRLRVHRDWFRGLLPDPIDHSHPDVGAAPDAQEQAEAQAQAQAGSGKRRLLQGLEAEAYLDAQSLRDRQRAISADAEASYAELFGEGQGRAGAAASEDGGSGKSQGSSGSDSGLSEAERMAGGEEIGWESLPVDADGLGGVGDWRDSAYGDYEGGWQAQPDPGRDAWADESYFAAPHKPAAGFVWLDAHILCTPAIGDIDGDGSQELVVAASYFFDREQYSSPERKAQLGGADPSKYVGGGIAVFDLNSNSNSKQLRWTQHLDLSTDHTAFRAYIYSAPTLADLDGDGKLEIIVGTSMGFVYVLDHTGRTREGWPLQMGEVQAQVAAADLAGDGRLAVVAADARGNVAAFAPDGAELWERHLASLLPQAPTFADVDGDGELEVLLGSTDGGVHALKARTGANLPHFPVWAQGRIMASVLPVRLRPGPGMQLVVPSYDGHLYVVDGRTGCTDVVDVGETAYATVLADDLDGDGSLDVLLATMNGNLYAFHTAAPADPLSVWPAQVPRGSGLTSPAAWLSVAATPAARRPRDVRGRSLAVSFSIRDARSPPANASLAPYTVSVSLQGVGRKEMAAGEQPVIGVSDRFARPGTYTLQVPCPRARATATVSLRLCDRTGACAEDSFSLSFHMRFHRLLKWALAGPFALACLAVLALDAGGLGLSLPSTQ